MENIIFTPIRRHTRAARLALPLWLAFRAEIKGNGDENPVAPLADFRRRVNIQGSRPDMHFDLMRIGKKKKPAGFAYYAIDKGTIGGLIEPNGGGFWGYYVAPEYRRQGYGRRMFLHCAEALRRDGAAYLYCCPDPVTGEPFWHAMGFEDSGIFDPDDRLNIFMKQWTGPEHIKCRAMTVQDLHIHMMDDYDEYQEITQEYRKRKLWRGYRVKKLRKPRVTQTSDGGKNYIRHWFIPNVHLRQYYPGQPLVFAAFRRDQVVAFAIWDITSAEKGRMGQARLYRLFVSRECRRMGLGRQLFGLCAEAARAEGAKTLFISANPAVETQAFYKSMGCVIAKKHSGPKKDIPLEFTL